MFALRKIYSKIPFPKNAFSTINPNSEVLAQFPFIFSPDLTITERVDSPFRTERSVHKDFISDKYQENKVKTLYIQVLKTFAGMSQLSGLKNQIEPRLYSRIVESLDFYKENNLKIGLLGSSVFGKSENALLQSFDVTQIGYMKVLDVDIERKKNLFIHQYEIEKTEERLNYKEKEDPKEKLKLKTKAEKKREEMKENLDELNEKKKDSILKKGVFGIAKSLGMMTPEDFNKPGALSRLITRKNELMGKMAGENYILVEDYEISSPLGFYIQDTKSGEVITSEGKDGDLFRHYLRVEKVVDAKDAPSIRKEKNYLLSDVDFFLRGNPHTLVRDFTL